MEIGQNIEKLELLKRLDSLNNQLTEVLLNKSQTIKEAYHINRKYISLVGKYEIDRYILYFDCEKMRRMILIYQSAINRQVTITEDEVNKIIAQETKEYEEKLKEIINNYEVSKNITIISTEEIKKIKETYRYIVKLIHPDLNPNLEPEHIELWHMTQDAYNRNDLNVLLIVKDILDNKKIIKKENKNEINELKIQIEKLINKIDETLKSINIIKNEYPYTRIHILNDEQLLNDEIDKIKDDIKYFEDLLKQLSMQLELIKFKPDGVS